MEVSEVTEVSPKASAKPTTQIVTDSLGRKIALKKLKPSERFLLSKVVDLPNLSTTMQAISVATVHSIDEEGFTPVRNEKDLLARLDQLGDEGLEAITGPVMEMYGNALSVEDANTAKN